MAQSRFPTRRESSWTPGSFGNWGDFMNRFMMPSFFLEPTMTTGAIAPVDVCERGDEFIIRMACAGCRPQDVDVTVENDTVRIRGRFPEHDETMMHEHMQQQGNTQQGTTQQFQGNQQNWQQNQQNWQGQQGQQNWQGHTQNQQTQTTQNQEQCLVRELPTGRFERDITLPMGVNSQQAHATFDNGLLTLHLPKTQASQGHRIQIGQGTTQHQGTSQHQGMGMGSH